MNTGNENDLSEMRLFARKLFYNICVCYLQKKGHVIGEYGFCKLYSNYCHAVILHYLELNAGIFEQVEKDYLEIWNNTPLKEISEVIIEEWQKIDNFPSDSEWYIYFAKVAILAMFESSHDISKFEIYVEKVTKLAEEAIKRNILCENYDNNRIKCKTIVNAVYHWFGTDLVHFTTVPDIKHGWDGGDILTSSLFYLNSNGRNFLSYLKRIEYYKEMDKVKFVTLLNQMQFLFLGGSDATVVQKSKFVLNASLLSLHCCLHCNFVHAAELVVDFLNRSSIVTS